jgi:hypothetical protein
MINPEQFYGSGDIPSPERRRNMWNKIEEEVIDKKKSFLFIPDRISFVYGIAASVILYFTAIGVTSTLRNAVADSRPEVVRLDEAYRSAIEQFERVVPLSISNASQDEQRTSYLSARKAQLQKLENAINELKRETSGADLSALKQKRLRQLYSLKLQVLQEMIENGEIEL